MLVEEWTGGKYKVETNQNLYIENGNWPKDFKLPPRNPYVSTGLAMKNDPSRDWKCLRRIAKKSNGELWFKADKYFNLPHGQIGIHLRNPVVELNVKNRVLFDIFWQGLSYFMGKDEDLLLANKAGIKAKLGGGVNAGEGRDHVTYNFVNPIILISGYDKNITDVLYQVVNYIEDFEFESLGEFHHHMGGLLGMYIGVLKQKCARINEEYGSKLLFENFHMLMEKKRVLELV